LDAQHCLAIAAAFIAIIAACASLITGANNKAESLTRRIYEVTKELRESKLLGRRERCASLDLQIDYYDGRFRQVQRAQRLMFLTIGIFVVCLTAFILLALYGSYYRIADVTAYAFARYLVAAIGVGVASGTLAMLQAIRLHFREVGQSYETLCIEMSDCQRDTKRPPAPARMRPAAGPLGRLSELIPFRRQERARKPAV
jgi:hypothetical protein